MRPDMHEGSLHSFNVAFQRELPARFTLDVAYVGNRGVNLVMDVDTNAGMVYGAGNNGRPNSRRSIARALRGPGRTTTSRSTTPCR